MIDILNTLLAGMSQPQYYSWSIFIYILNTIIIGVAVIIASLTVVRAITAHKSSKPDKHTTEQNTYRLVVALNNLYDSFCEQFSPKHIQNTEQCLIHNAKYRTSRNSSLDLSHIIHRDAIYILMLPIYKSLSFDALFLYTHHVNWTNVAKIVKPNYCSLCSAFPIIRKQYAQSHPNFKICYNLYRKMKGGN